MVITTGWFPLVYFRNQRENTVCFILWNSCNFNNVIWNFVKKSKVWWFWYEPIIKPNHRGSPLKMSSSFVHHHYCSIDEWTIVTGNIGSFNNSPNTVRLVHDERDRRQSSEQGDTFKTPTLCIIRIGDWPFIAVGHGGSRDRIRKGRALNDAGKNVCYTAEKRTSRCN